MGSVRQWRHQIVSVPLSATWRCRALKDSDLRLMGLNSAVLISALQKGVCHAVLMPNSGKPLVYIEVVIGGYRAGRGFANSPNRRLLVAGIRANFCGLTALWSGYPCGRTAARQTLSNVRYFVSDRCLVFTRWKSSLYFCVEMSLFHRCFGLRTSPPEWQICPNDVCYRLKINSGCVRFW